MPSANMEIQPRYLQPANLSAFCRHLHSSSQSKLFYVFFPQKNLLKKNILSSLIVSYKQSVIRDGAEGRGVKQMYTIAISTLLWAQGWCWVGLEALRSLAVALAKKSVVAMQTQSLEALGKVQVFLCITKYALSMEFPFLLILRISASPGNKLYFIAVYIWIFFILKIKR